MQDSVQRSLNGAKTSGATSITFDTPERALVDGESIIFDTHSTEYTVSACTSTTCTISPALTTNVADNVKFTRQDPYRLVEFDDLKDDYFPDETLNDKKVAGLFRLYFRTREYLEQRCEHVFKSRTITEVISLDCDTDTLTLKYRPAISITSIVIQYLNSTAMTVDSTAYSLNAVQGTVYGAFPAGQNHITVTYVAGWSTVRSDHQLLFMQLFQYMFALSPMGKDALSLQSNSKLETTFRTLEEVDQWIDRNFPQRRILI